MISEDQARSIAQAYVDAQWPEDQGDQLVLLDSQTIERVWGWVFFYTSRRWLETGDVSSAVAGNAPIIVRRADGAIHVPGTAYPIEHYIEQFEHSIDRL